MKKILLFIFVVIVFLISGIFMYKLFNDSDILYDFSTTTTNIIMEFEDYTLIDKDKQYSLYKLKNNQLNDNIKGVSVKYNNNKFTINGEKIFEGVLFNQFAIYENKLIFIQIDGKFSKIIEYDIKNKSYIVKDKIDDYYIEKDNIIFNSYGISLDITKINNNNINFLNKQVDICFKGIDPNYEVEHKIIYIYENKSSEYEIISTLDYTSYIKIKEKCQ